ncbi:MAG: Uma2 family endonuclease [Defluviitaleaceae bacterium]|nr:Uma2 family endonuclease [Defluviitaleaceae bacterium]
MILKNGEHFEEKIIEDEKRRTELIDGVYYFYPEASFGHGMSMGSIHRIFSNYLRGKKCVVTPDGVNLFLDEENTFRPDIMVICNLDIIKHNGIHGTPDLVVEILSPSTAKNDRSKKKDIYERYGVKEFWIVDVANRSIEVYLNDGKKFHLDEVYVVFRNYEKEEMTTEEIWSKENVKVSLFDDLVVNLEEVFENII